MSEKTSIQKIKRIGRKHKAFFACGAVGLLAGTALSVAACSDTSYDYQITLDRESENVNYFTQTGTEQTTAATLEGFVSNSPTVGVRWTGKYLEAAKANLWPNELTAGWNINIPTMPWTMTGNVSATKNMHIYITTTRNVEAGATELTTAKDLTDNGINLATFNYVMGSAGSFDVYYYKNGTNPIALDHINVNIRNGLTWNSNGKNLGAVAPEDFLAGARLEMDSGLAGPYQYMHQLNTGIVNSAACVSNSQITDPSKWNFFNSQSCKDFFNIDPSGNGIVHIADAKRNDPSAYKGIATIDPSATATNTAYTLRLTYNSVAADGTANQGRNTPLNMALSMFSTQLYWASSLTLLTNIGGNIFQHLYDTSFQTLNLNPNDPTKYSSQFRSAMQPFGTSPSTWAGYGPFYMDRWTQRYVVHFTRNPDYWNAASVPSKNFQIRLGGIAAITQAVMFQYGYLSESVLGNEFKQQLENYNGSKNFVGQAPNAGVTRVQVWNTANRVFKGVTDLTKQPLNIQITNDANFRVAMRYASNTTLFHSLNNKPDLVGSSIYSDLGVANSAPGVSGTETFLDSTAKTKFLVPGASKTIATTQLNTIDSKTWQTAFQGKQPADYNQDKITDLDLAKYYWGLFMADPVGQQVNASSSPIVLNIITNPAQSDPTAAQRYVDSAMEALGGQNKIKFLVKLLPTTAAFFGTFYGAAENSWDGAMLSWNPDYNDPTTFYSTILKSDPSINSNESGSWNYEEQMLSYLSNDQANINRTDINAAVNKAGLNSLLGDPADQSTDASGWAKANPAFAGTLGATVDKVATAVLNTVKYTTDGTTWVNQPSLTSALNVPGNIAWTAKDGATDYKDASSVQQSFDFSDAYWGASAPQRAAVMLAIEIMNRDGGAVYPIGYDSQSYKGSRLIGNGVSQTGQENFAYAYDCRNAQNGLPGCDAFNPQP